MLFCQTRLLHGLRRHAEDLVRSQKGADILRLHIALAHMHTVRIHLAGDLDIVIDKERHAALTAECLQLLCLREEVCFIKGLFPQLHHRDATVQTLAHNIDQPTAVQPVAVGDSVEQQVLFIAVHTVRPRSASRRPCCRWRQ